MADLLITRTKTGVATAKTTDPFSSFEVHRIDRAAWSDAPERAGVYLLYGFVEQEQQEQEAGSVQQELRLGAYVGMSTTNMRDRIRSHHVAPRKNWFGVIFAIPLSPLLCPAIEAEMIRRVREAGVVGVVDNRADEGRWLDADDVHIAPALDSIVGALEMLLGNDIFSPRETDDRAVGVDSLERSDRLARTYKDQARDPRARSVADPEGATHAYVGAGILAWGRFEGNEPDTRFRVLQGSTWRRATLDLAQASYANQARVASRQEPLISDGTLDAETMKFTADHVFENWSQAVGVVSGKGSYSGGYHWQLIQTGGGS